MAKRELKLPTSYAVAVSDNDEYLATAGRNVVLASVFQRQRIFSIHPFAHPSHLDFSPRSDQLAVKNTLGEICLVRIPDGSVMAKHRPQIREEGPQIIYSACGGYVSHVTWSGKLYVHRASDLSVEHQIEFPGDKPFAITASADKTLWLTGHLRGSTDLPLDARLTLLMIWRWPFTQPIAVHELPSHYLCDAALSPCGSYIAVLRQRFGPTEFQLSILTVNGERIATTRIEDGRIGYKIRWCRTSSRLGLIAQKAFTVFQAPTLLLQATFPHKYPSALAFISSCNSVLLGTWEYGVVATLPDA